jgi:integrase
VREIKPLNNNGSIYLRFTVSGRRYGFAPVPGGDFSKKRDLRLAGAIATQIERDIWAGCFDPSLARYRVNGGTVAIVPVKLSILELWDLWVESLDLSPETKADHYEMVRRMIAKAGAAAIGIDWLTKADIAPSTFNKRLGYMNRFYRWAVGKRRVDENPFEDVQTRKAIKSKVKPFTEAEMSLILEAFKQRFPHYCPFVRFMFRTGARTSEAIGLQWRHIDFDRSEVRISESLPKDRTGNGYQRKRKGTKTDETRVLSLGAELTAWLGEIKPQGAKDDDLVFQSSKGCVIDSGNFREDWKSVLESLEIDYQKPYTTRHTLLSHAIEQGMPLTGAAYIAGHSDTRTVQQFYAHMINRPELPNLDV